MKLAFHKALAKAISESKTLIEKHVLLVIFMRFISIVKVSFIWIDKVRFDGCCTLSSIHVNVVVVIVVVIIVVLQREIH